MQQKIFCIRVYLHSKKMSLGRVGQNNSSQLSLIGLLYHHSSYLYNIVNFIEIYDYYETMSGARKGSEIHRVTIS